MLAVGAHHVYDFAVPVDLYDLIVQRIIGLTGTPYP
jgi:hypothetical protein